MALDGMTVNERLFHLGLFAEFDDAVNCRDKTRIVGVLLKAELSADQAEESAAAILAAPEKYVF